MNAVVISLSAAFLYALLFFIEKEIISGMKDYFSWAILVSIAGGIIAIPLLSFNLEWIKNPLPLVVSGVSAITGYLLYLKALNRTNPSTIGVLMSSRPLISVIFSVLILSEHYSTQSIVWLLVISGAFILFSLNPVGKRDLLSPVLAFSAVIVWIAGDSMIKFSSSSGVWFVLGRSFYELPIALALLVVFRNRVKFDRIRGVWKLLPAYFVMIIVALTLFFMAASESFAIANAVSNSMTAVFTVALGALAAFKGLKRTGETGSMSEYAYKALIAGVIAFSVYQLYLSY